MAPGRHTAGGDSRWQLIDHRCSRPNHAPITDFDTDHRGGPGAHQDAVAKFDRSGKHASRSQVCKVADRTVMLNRRRCIDDHMAAESSINLNCCVRQHDSPIADLDCIGNISGRVDKCLPVERERCRQCLALSIVTNRDNRWRAVWDRRRRSGDRNTKHRLAPKLLAVIKYACDRNSKVAEELGDHFSVPTRTDD